jgi:hypothetical protein
VLGIATSGWDGRLARGNRTMKGLTWRKKLQSLIYQELLSSSNEWVTTSDIKRRIEAKGAGTTTQLIAKTIYTHMTQWEVERKQVKAGQSRYKYRLRGVRLTP